MSEIRLDIMRKMIGYQSDKNVLEIGLDTLIMTKTSCNLTTLDINEKNKPTIVHDLNELPLPIKNSTFDCIVCGEVIEHLIRPLEFLEECNRIIKNGGSMVLSVPNISSLKSRFKGLFGHLPEHCARGSLTGNDYGDSHVRDFNFSEIKKFLMLSGFKIVEHSSNGVVVHKKKILSHKLSPTTWGECIIIKCIKVHKNDNILYSKETTYNTDMTYSEIKSELKFWDSKEDNWEKTQRVDELKKMQDSEGDDKK